MIDAYAIPQDEYFEWEDIMENHHFAYNQGAPHMPDIRTPINCGSLVKEVESQDTDSKEPILRYESSTFNWASLQSDSDISESDMPLLCEFPDEGKTETQEAVRPSINTEGPISYDRPVEKSRDDLSITIPATQNVDYLAHPWHLCKADLWASRKQLRIKQSKNIDSEDQTYDRLMNACWRAEAVAKLQLKKVDPRSFNWLKEQDVTWLYGPFVSHVSKPTSDHFNHRSSLKPKTYTKAERSEHQIKSILKYSSSSSLLLRGSVLPPVKARKRINDSPFELKKRQKHNVRFSSEVLHFTTFPVAHSKTNTSTATPDNFSVPMTSFVSNPSISTSQDWTTNLGLKYQAPPVSGTTDKHRLPSLRAHNSITQGMPQAKTVCHVSSGKLQPEHVSDDDAVALQRALREVVDAHQWSYLTHEYRSEMPLWPTITA